jgi:hypothetical protein
MIQRRNPPSPKEKNPPPTRLSPSGSADPGSETRVLDDAPFRLAPLFFLARKRASSPTTSYRLASSAARRSAAPASAPRSAPSSASTTTR